MIEKNTVFILGAGASLPYGYPTGKDLRSIIVNDPTDGFIKYLNSVYSSSVMLSELADKYINFIRAFDKSSTKSIDLFLGRNPKLRFIGKYLIMHYILRSEFSSKFREKVDNDEDWYTYLFNRLTDKLSKPGDIHITNNNISFITFNYDRSLEHFLYESLMNSYLEVDKSDILSVINNIDIVHVFGKVFELDWQGRIPKVKYQQQNLMSIPLDDYVNNIQTINENKIIEPDGQVTKILKNAESIFFLGFGYLEENMNILGFPDVAENVNKIYGTGIGLYEKERQDIINKYFYKMNNYAKNAQLRTINSKSLLREYL